LFVYQPSDTRSALYFDNAVGAAAQTAVMLDKVTVDRVANVDPSSYAFVVISDVASLPAAFNSSVLNYVRRGGDVLVVLGTVAAQQRETPFFGARILTSRHYSTDAERFAAVGQTDGAYPAAGSPEEWEGVKFFYAAAVDEHDARVAVRLQDGTPLVLEKQVGEGRVMVFASGFDNLTNDLPLHPVFVAFVERMVRHLSGGDAQSGPHLVDDVVALRTAREQAVGVEVVDPSGRRPLSLQEAVSSQSYPLTEVGFYEVHLANGRRDLIAVNADRRESDLTPISDEVLALWRGSAGAAGTAAGLASAGDSAVNGTAVPGSSSGSAAAAVAAGQARAQPTAVPRSLWWYAMFGVLAAALAESMISGRYLGTLRDEP
jgi:hypothetical protein